MGWIPPTFLHCHGNDQGRLHQLYWHASRNASPQIQKICHQWCQLYCPARIKQPHNRFSLPGRSIHQQLYEPCYPHLTGTTLTCHDSRDDRYSWCFLAGYQWQQQPNMQEEATEEWGAVFNTKNYTGFWLWWLRKKPCALNWQNGRSCFYLEGLVHAGKRGMVGKPFKEFEMAVAKLWHAFTCIPLGARLLLPCYWVLKVQLPYVFLHQNVMLLNALEGCRTLLWESTREPTRCCKLTCGWTDFIGIVDVSSRGVRGVIFGKISACTPMVFRWKWPDNIQSNIQSFNNLTGTITNSNLKMTGLLLLWLAMEGVCRHLREKWITLFCDNSPLISWVTCLASKWSLMAKHLVQALALRLKIQRTCPLQWATAKMQLS
jgi:hypothetical protein